MKSKNCFLNKINKPLLIKDFNLPDPRPGEVMVKIFFSGICRSQIMEISGHRNNNKFLPHFLGHEGSGIVIKVGAGVKKVKKNDEVILTWIRGRGMEVNNGKIINKDTIVNYGPITTLGQYSLISENRLVKKPKNMDRKIAALFGCALCTGFGIVLNEFKINKNKNINVAVYGLGGIGYSSLVMLKCLGIKNITILDNNYKKLKIAKKIGIKNIVNTSNNNFSTNNKNYLKNTFDLCIETCGYKSTIEKAFDLIKNKGKVIFASHPKKLDKISIDPFELIKGKKIVGTWGGDAYPDKDINFFYNKVKKNLRYLEPMTKNIYALSQVNKAIKDLSSGNVLRPLIKM
jgi:S-(hydroxymethyl)glutathione dehydrogenase/alcohol dehydrogenase